MHKFKLAIVNDFIPIPSASTINLLKHSSAFYRIVKELKIFTIEHFAQTKWRIKLGNINKFYGIDQNIRFFFLIGNLFFYFRKYKITWPIVNFFIKFPIKNNFFDPQIRIILKIFKNQCNLIYCRHVYRTAFYAIKSQIPTIIETHNYSNPPDFLKLLRLGKDPYFRALVTISLSLKKDYIKKGFPSDKILVLEDAVDWAHFSSVTSDKMSLRRQLGLPLDKKIVIYTGSLSEDRAIDIILRAANQLDPKTHSFCFVGGSKREVVHWKRYISIHDLRGDIQFMGFQPQKWIPYYLKAADVLLATYSPRCLTLKWMSPIKLFEYMASGTPIIATRIGRIPEICSNDECLLVEPEDERDLAEKIERLLHDEPLRQALAKKALQKASQHTYEKRCQKILSFIK